MHSFLISGSDEKAIENKIKTFMTEWHVSNFDTFTIDKEEEKKEISIQQIRALTKQLSLAPAHGPFNVAIVNCAHIMTIAAQNAMLKILEEPPAKTKIILTSTMPDALLQTILSRCEKYTVITASDSEIAHAVTLQTLFQFETQSVSRILAFTDSLATTNQEAVSFVDSALQCLHTAIITDTTPPYGPTKCAKLAEILLKTRRQLSANVNQKLALDNCFLEARQG
jgi:hypothetical protein